MAGLSRPDAEAARRGALRQRLATELRVHLPKGVLDRAVGGRVMELRRQQLRALVRQFGSTVSVENTKEGLVVRVGIFDVSYMSILL